jgi:hypothetical protein
MPFDDYLIGALFFVATLACVGIATAWVVRRRLSHLSGAAEVLAASLVATAGLILVHLIPGLLGILERENVLVTALIGLAAVWRLPPVSSPAPPLPARPPADSGPFSWAVAALAVGGLAVYILAFGISHALVATPSIDATAFHLPNVATWIHTKSLWSIKQFLPYQGYAYYPQNGNVIYLAAILPWRNDFLARFVDYPFLVLTGVAVYALGRELRAPQATAVVMAAVVVAVPTVLQPAIDYVMPDPIMLAAFGTGLLFLARHARTAAGSDLVLAGLGLGIAFGTKWYGPPAVAVVIVTWAIASAISGRRTALVLRQGLVLSALVATAGGVWMLRNLIETGDPVFPAKVAPLGITIFDAPPDRFRAASGFTIADYLGQPDVLKEYIWPAVKVSLGFAPVLLALGLVGAIVFALVGHGGRVVGNRGRVIAGAACTFGLAVAYALTPYSAWGPEGRPFLSSATTRYAVPSLMIAAALTAWAAGRLASWRPVLEVAGLVLVADGVRRVAADYQRVSLSALGAAVLAVAAATGLLVLARRRGVASIRWQPVAIAGTLAAVIVVVGGQPLQTRFNDERYRGGDTVISWLVTNAPEGHRVGLAGIWEKGVFPVLPSFGPRLENEVSFVGPVSRSQLQTYKARKTFVSALRRGRYDLVLVGRGIPAKPSVKEDAWTRSAGFERVARSSRFTLYRRPGTVGGERAAASSANGDGVGTEVWATRTSCSARPEVASGAYRPRGALRWRTRRMRSHQSCYRKRTSS